MNDPLPPLLFPAKERGDRSRLAALIDAKRAYRVAPRLFATVPKPSLPAVIRSSWPAIVARLFPQALLSHRTALTYLPSPAHEIFLTSTTNRVVEYPGLSLVFGRGAAPLADDVSFMGIRASSLPRALLENLEHSRAARSRVLRSKELEERLERELVAGGEARLNEIRDRARQIADQLGRKTELERLTQMIGTLLGTRTSRLSSEVGRARALGEPYDPACLERLQILAAALRSHPLGVRQPVAKDPASTTNKAFFEAYFSNFIEGTTFGIEEAEHIVFDHVIPTRRPKDAHDVLGTFELVSNRDEMRRVPEQPAALIDLLQARHRVLMRERPEVGPGELKTVANRAGNTRFVEPAYVRGTLSRGFAIRQDLEPGLARAIFMMFLISDVHPFDDGNGRIARIFMNAELVVEEHATIIVPTVFRDDYLGALRALTRRNRAQPLIDALDKAQQFSNLRFTPYPTALAEIQRRNWFRDPDEARVVTD